MNDKEAKNRAKTKKENSMGSRYSRVRLFICMKMKKKVGKGGVKTCMRVCVFV